MLSYWNETLKNISQDQRKDKFVFIVNNIRIEVPLSYALGISPFITEEYLKDPTFKEFKININIRHENENAKEKENKDKEKLEEEFLKFVKGKEIRKEIFVEIGKQIKNKEMIKKWKNSNEKNKESIMKYIKSIHEIEDTGDINDIEDKGNIENIENVKEEIEYIGNHLEEMKEEIKELKLEEIIYILRKEDISIKSEDTIWEIIKERINEMKSEKNYRNREMRRILFENIQIKYLNKQHFKEYIEEIEGEDFFH